MTEIPFTHEQLETKDPAFVRFLRHQATRLSVAFALGAGVVHEGYQQSMHPVQKWQSKEWRPLEMLEGINEFQVTRTYNDVLLHVRVYDEDYEFSLKENDVELTVGLPWHRLHVRVDDKGQILGRTSDYPIAHHE